MDILMNIWSYFATNILQQPAFMIGLIVIIGYILLKKPWYDVLGGGIKAIVGYMILAVGSGGLVSNFRPVLVGLKDRFNLDAMVIDPYFGQNAVTAGVEEVFGQKFSQVMMLLLRIHREHPAGAFQQVHQAARPVYHRPCAGAAGVTAFWLILFACPFLTNNTAILIVMALILGCYWAVGSNLTIKPIPGTDGRERVSVSHISRCSAWRSSHGSRTG